MEIGLGEDFFLAEDAKEKRLEHHGDVLLLESCRNSL
jgi:hypothetical protein